MVYGREYYYGGGLQSMTPVRSRRKRQHHLYTRRVTRLSERPCSGSRTTRWCATSLTVDRLGTTAVPREIFEEFLQTMHVRSLVAKRASHRSYRTAST